MNLEMMAKLSDDQRGYIATVIKDLNSIFIPHNAQKKIGNALFYQGKKKIFVECGRKAGKSDALRMCLYRMALLFPGSYYYIAPFLKQAKEIMWADGRLQNFLPPELKKKYVLTVNDSELRIKFKNGSFIKLDGADNYEAYRGVNPHGIVYDEFKDFHPEFHSAMDPNLAPHRAPLIIVGTPPEGENNDFIRLADYCKKNQDGECAYFNYPTWVNPHIDKDWLRAKKQELFDRGDEDVWYREYEAKRVYGGKRSVFPMWKRESMLYPHQKLIEEIARDKKKLTWQCIADPAAASVFGVLFRAINPYTQKIYHLDCLYERDPKEMTTANMWAKIDRIIQELNPDIKAWQFIYDEAAAWFANEMSAIFHQEQIENAWNYSEKIASTKEDGINLIRQQMLDGKYLVSERCLFKEGGLVWEIENYIKDKNGKIPKLNDHLIDCARYGDIYAQYYTIEKVEPAPKEETRRFYTPEMDLYKHRMETDMTLMSDRFEEDYV